MISRWCRANRTRKTRFSEKQICPFVQPDGNCGSSPSLFPFLFSYLWPARSMQTLISTACASVQWNDLPKATWKSHELSRPGSCNPLIRERCAWALEHGLSDSTLFPTSHASSPLPWVTEIERCWGLRNMYATIHAWRTWSHSGHVLMWLDGGVGRGDRSCPHSWASVSVGWPCTFCPHRIFNKVIHQCYGIPLAFWNIFVYRAEKGPQSCLTNTLRKYSPWL